MLRDALEYPLEGDDAVTSLVVGGVLSLLSSVLLVPAVLIGGYSVAVCRAVLAGESEPPPFDDWGQVAVDGLSVLAITVLYWLPGLVLAGIGAGAGFLVLAGAAGDMTAITGSVVLLVGAIGSLAGLAYAAAVAYLLPAAIVNYARTNQVSAAWDVGTLRTIGSDAEYAKAWLLAAAVLFGFNSAGSSLVVFLVGFLVLFFGQVVAMYVFTRGTMAALDITPDTAHENAGGVHGNAGEAPGNPDAATDAETHDEYVRPADRDSATGDGEEGGGADGADDATPASDEGTAVPGERSLEDVAAVGPTTAAALRDGGYESVGDLRAATRAELAALEAVGPATANRIKTNVEGE